MSARDNLADIAEDAIDNVHNMDVTLRDYAEAATDAVLAALPELVPQWKPIETAPKDGTVFDVWCSEHNNHTDAPRRIANCRYSDGVLKYLHSHGWFTLNSFDFSHATVTHWMPLPPAPEAVLGIVPEGEG